MSLRTSNRTAPRELQTIHPEVLDQVVGGRISPRTTLDPVLLKCIQELSQAIVAVGQNLAASQQGSMQMVMQVMQQMMQGRRR